MNTVLKTREASVRYLDAVEPPLVQKFDSLAGAPGGVARLRELILGLATAGRLVVTRGDQSHWQRRTLDQVGEWGSGGTPSKSHPEYYAGGTIPWLVIGDLNDGVVQSAATCISDLGLRNSSAKIVEPGTVLVAMYGSIGKLGVAGLRCATNQAIAFCRPNADVVTGDFLFLFLRSIRASLLQRGQGLAQQNISQKILRNIEISVPPLAEQARIVARVDELMQLCDALEAKGRLEAQQHARLLETLLGTLTDSTTPEELAANWQRVAEHFDLLLDRPEAVDGLEQTILQLAVRGVLVPQDAVDEPTGELLERGCAEKDRLVARGIINPFKPLAAVSDDDHPYELPGGWKWSRLGSIGITSTGGTPPTSRPECFGGEIAFIGPGQISARGQILTAEKFISELGRQETSIAESGDLLMVCIGGSIGKCAMVHRTTAFNQQINSIRFLFGLSTYLLIAMSSLDFQRQVLGAATGSATPIISKGKWDTLLVPVPPLAEQDRIVARVAELRRLCADLRQCLAASQATQSRLAGALVESALA